MATGASQRTAQCNSSGRIRPHAPWAVPGAAIVPANTLNRPWTALYRTPESSYEVGPIDWRATQRPRPHPELPALDLTRAIHSKDKVSPGKSVRSSRRSVGTARSGFVGAQCAQWGHVACVELAG